MISKATYRQWLSCVMALTVSFIYGCKVGWTSATTTLFLSDDSPIQATPNDITWMVSVAYTGTIFSVLLCYNFSDKFSRKHFVLGCTIFYVFAWASILFTSSMTVIIVCFFFYGIACSMLYIVCNIYIGEIANPKNREMIGASYNFATAIGMQVEYMMYAFDNYRWLALFPMLVSIFALLISVLMIESPYYLVSKGREEQALQTLNYLNDKDNDDSVADLETVRKYVNEQKNRPGAEENFRIILMPANLKLILILVIVNGVSIMNSSCIVSGTGSLMLNNFKDSVDGNLFVNIYSTLRIVFMLCSFVTIKKFKRRSLFLVGYVTTGFIQLICAIGYYIEEQNGNSIGWLANVIAYLHVLFLVIYLLTFAVALEILKLEIFPHKFKEFYTSILCFTSDCFAFAVTQSYFYVEPVLGNSFLMLVYTCISVVGATVIYFFVQDTKGKTLQQIRTDLNTESQSLNR